MRQNVLGVQGEALHEMRNSKEGLLPRLQHHNEWYQKSALGEFPGLMAYQFLEIILLI